MNNRTKMLLLVAALFLLFTSCSQSTANDTSDSTDKNSADTADIAETPAEELPNYLTLEGDLGGEAFRVLGMYSESYKQFSNFEIYAESENGDIVNDAVYRRNSIIEEKYNVKIEQVLGEMTLAQSNTPLLQLMQKNTMAGDDAYELFFIPLRDISGVISGKPIHLLSGDEGKKLPKADSLYIDIGAISKEDAEKYVMLGDRGVICGDPIVSGEKILSKALDDRIGCAILITLLRQESEYDFYASFSVQEELGLRGAKTAAFAIDPQCAIVLEGTTAADIADVPEEKSVCKLGLGPAVSFMDGATVYDRDFYNAAMNSGIDCQPKAAVTGGNNAGSIHLSRDGVRTVGISVPCRYIHTASSVASLSDCENAIKLAEYMLCGICGGEIK